MNDIHALFKMTILLNQLTAVWIKLVKLVEWPLMSCSHDNDLSITNSAVMTGTAMHSLSVKI